MTRISVIIVSRNRIPQLRESLTSLGTDHQVIVVDNGSSGGVGTLQEEFPQARFIRLPKNFGLTKALNLGIRSAEGEFVLFLHDDTLITSDGVSELANFLDANSDVGAVAPLLVDKLGRPTAQIRPHPPLPALIAAEGTADLNVPSITGAALMVRAFFLKAMRQIDERYGNFGSDLDLCAQVQKRANKKVRIVQSVRAVHQDSLGSSSISASDAAIGTAVYLSKYQGSVAGMKHRIGTALNAVITLRWALAKHLLSSQKIDGTQ